MLIATVHFAVGAEDEVGLGVGGIIGGEGCLGDGSLVGVGVGSGSTRGFSQPAISVPRQSMSHSSPYLQQPP
jgi:hypothetical protein